MTVTLWLVAAYLVGAIPASYLAARVGQGIDLRRHGSRNLGATNLYRLLGWRYAVPVGVFDVAKGFAPVMLVSRHPELPSWSPLLVGAAAIVGHVYPVYLGFRGGKGVATAAGVMLGLAPLAVGVSAAVWISTLGSTRLMSLSSMLGAAAFPLAAGLLYPERAAVTIAGTILAVFIVFNHRANIRRLFQREEPRLSRPKSEVRGSTS